MHQSFTVAFRFLLSLLVMCRATKVINVKPGQSNSIISPNYPMKYELDNTSKWEVHGEEGCRIIVEFEDFSTDEPDSLYISDASDPSTAVSYSGVGKNFTPYVSRGSHVVLSFDSDLFYAERGFNLTVGCHLTGEPKIDEAVVFTNGLVRMKKGDLNGICSDGWNIEAADVVCREAGYPGAYNTSVNQDTRSTAVTLGYNLSCQKSHFRIQDCELKRRNCTTITSATIFCNSFDFVGCYNLVDHIHEFVMPDIHKRQQCLDYCNREFPSKQFTAIYQEKRCACFQTSDLDVKSLKPHESMCRGDNRMKRAVEFWVTVYNTSVGFCGDLPTLENGKWLPRGDEQSSYVGSKMYASCNDGYILQPTNFTLTCELERNSSTTGVAWQPEDKFPTCVLQLKNLTNYSDKNRASTASVITSFQPTLVTAADIQGDTVTIVISIVALAVFCFIVSLIVLWKRRKIDKRMHLPSQNEDIKVDCLINQPGRLQDTEEQQESLEVVVIAPGNSRKT